ncbi:LysR family transcriptional regulator [Paracraurococcus ruber]|uniref:LysR family transcriptional regulator n=1 Tax=Paracraurococcus ruber TaxID=77675 RepID=UPI0023D950B1|nr:LysR family transcriptional regulator [Paracraurococcus ruber]
MSHRLPPLNALRAFEAAGRHLSFKRAAGELSVTPGAVSQQIRHLEQVLGFPLFQRLPRGLLLTGHGEALLPVIGEAFERVSAALEEVATAMPGRILRLGISPRLTRDPEGLLAALVGPGGAEAFIRVQPTDDVGDLLSGAINAVLRPGRGPYPGLQAEALDLHPAFAPHRRATLVTWPGLAQCREVRRARALLGQA